AVHQYGSFEPFNELKPKSGRRAEEGGPNVENATSMQECRKPARNAAADPHASTQYIFYFFLRNASGTVLQRGDVPLASSSSCARNSRTSHGASKWPLTPLARRPTENASPCISGMIANTLSSVTSSPMKSGRRPTN